MAANNLSGKKIDEEKLTQVNGGFTADSGYTKGMEIKCPNCGNTDKHLFEHEMIGTQEGDYYHCLKCEAKFYAYPGGYIENDI